MSDHDSVKQLNDLFSNDELIRKISPKFSELNLDIREISAQCKDPMFLAVLLFKLAEEREKTNKLLEQIAGKFDAIMAKVKTTEAGNPRVQENPLAFAKEPALMLPEQDQMIVHLAHAHGQVTAEDVKAELGYKGKNAASQRLNRLFREGHLRKVQSGRKVLYLAKNMV